MNKYWLFILVLFAACTSKKEQPAQAITELPFKTLSLENLDGFKEGEHSRWGLHASVFSDRRRDHHLETTEGEGILAGNPSQGERLLLTTAFQHTDLDLKIDFMLSKGADVQLYFLERYGIQLTDSWKAADTASVSCGSIGFYSEEESVIVAPALNACKAPGLWQHLYVRFKAPRFGSSGEQIADARFEEVWLNGKLIQENVALAGAGNKGAGPASLQFSANNGPVAFRNIQYKAYKEDRIALHDMSFEVYKGLYKKYDTLKTFTPVRTGQTDSLHWKAGDKRAQIVFKGSMDVPVEGNYLFRLRAGGPAWLLIDDKEIVSNKGTRDYTHAHYGSTTLSKGPHTFSVIYANYDESLVLEYEGPELPMTPLTARTAERLVKEISPLEYTLDGKAAIQRGFFTHRGNVNTYTMCVGMPDGLNYAYDMSTYSLLSAWRGKFIDVSNMWTERGESQMELPLGAPLELPGIPCVLQLADVSDNWTDTVQVDNSIYTKRGYRIDSTGLPVFTYSYRGVKIEDHVTAYPGQDGFLRAISATVDQPEKNLYFLLGSGRLIEQLPDGSYAVDDKEYYIEVPERKDEKEPIIAVAKNGRHELLLPISENKTQSFQYAIIW